MAVIAGMLLGPLLILFLPDNLGVDVTALIAGLGIGGIIIALALQNVVADMLGALAILVGKPFVVGDFIEAQGMMGTVEGVGLRSTRMERIPVIAREAVERHPLVRFDRAHFRTLCDWSLEFDVIYFIASSDFAVYADIQHRSISRSYGVFAPRGLLLRYRRRKCWRGK